MGSVAQDKKGNMALGYSISSETVFPSIRFTGRKRADPPGDMTIAEGSIMEGTGSQTSSFNRWGDYTSSEFCCKKGQRVRPSLPINDSYISCHSLQCFASEY
jgi:hypothetical protein